MAKHAAAVCRAGSARWPGSSGRAVLGLRGGHLVVSVPCRRGAARGLKLCAMQTRRGENLKFVLPCWVASDLHAATRARVWDARSSARARGGKQWAYNRLSYKTLVSQLVFGNLSVENS
jgi:hypothetical protein